MGKISELTTKSNPVGADLVTGLDSEDANVQTKNKNFTVESIGNKNFSDKTTDDLDEGVNNLYYTENRVDNNATVVSKEDKSNKSTNIITDTGSDIKYPSVKAVEDYVDNFSIPDATTTIKGKVELATDEEVNQGVSSNKVVTPTSMKVYASDSVIVSSNSLNSTSNTTMTKLKDIEVSKFGTYRVTFSMYGDTGSGTAEAQIYVNDIPTGILRSSNEDASNPDIFTEDIGPILAGANIQIYGRDNGDSCKVLDFKIGATMIETNVIL